PARASDDAALRAASASLRAASAPLRAAAEGAAPGAAPAALDFETVCRRWSEFTQALRGSKAMLAHCLGGGQPARFTAEPLEVAFAPEHAFPQHLFEEAVKRRELEGYLAQFFGAPLRVAIARDTAPAAAAAAPAPAPAPAQRITSQHVADSRRDAIDDVVER